MEMDLLLVALICVLSCLVLHDSEAFYVRGPSVKSATFLSPPIILRPGLASNKNYYDIPFPRGHIALKSFDAEVVDENGVPVPLHETYLHHWVVQRYYIGAHGMSKEDSSKLILVRNSGVCDNTLDQYYGLGSETRRTATWVPDPYGIVVGNPNDIPEGYEERWFLNVHAIDTRGVNDRSGCTECSCKLYNTTRDEYGRQLPENYVGGLRCCYDQAQCEVKPGYSAADSSRKLFLKYTVMWVDQLESVIPVKVYILDVTDTAMLPVKRKSTESNSTCQVEYDVKECNPDIRAKNECIDVRTARVVFPTSGDIVYGVAHQHSGGIGSALYGEDGRELCASIPTYGEGEEAGNEANYIVGMTTCYPKPGSITVQDGEILTLVSNYSSTRMHTGVMGLFYILVAEPGQAQAQAQLENGICFHFICVSAWTLAFVLAGAVLALAIGLSYFRSNRRNKYEPLVISQ